MRMFVPCWLEQLHNHIPKSMDQILPPILSVASKIRMSVNPDLTRSRAADIPDIPAPTITILGWVFDEQLWESSLLSSAMFYGVDVGKILS